MPVSTSPLYLMATSVVRLVVTGGAGFLGRAVIESAHERHPNWHIYSLDIRPPSEELEIGVENIQLDIRDANAVLELFQSIRPDAIVHCAGLVPAGNARYDQSLMAKVLELNVGGTENMLLAARACGTAAFCYTSSVCRQQSYCMCRS